LPLAQKVELTPATGNKDVTQKYKHRHIFTNIQLNSKNRIGKEKIPQDILLNNLDATTFPYLYTERSRISITWPRSWF